jgi:DNA-binding NtrC family response regulator
LALCLAEHGYEVETAGNAPEAISLLGSAANDEPFDLVLSDVAMPGGSGTDLLFSPAVTDRHIPVILMSAFGTDALREFVRETGAELLQKPFKLDSLFECVLSQLRTRFQGDLAARAGERASIA